MGVTDNDFKQIYPALELISPAPPTTPKRWIPEALEELTKNTPKAGHLTIGANPKGVGPLTGGVQTLVGGDGVIRGGAPD